MANYLYTDIRGSHTMTHLQSLTLSRHATKRCAQRGIRKEFLNDLLKYADVEVQVGGGAIALSVSKTTATTLDLGNRFGHYAVIISQDATIISVLPLHNCQRGRIYRKGRN